MTTQPPVSGEPGPPPPPPAPGAPVSARGPMGPAGAGPRPLPPAGPNPWLMLLVGLIIGLLIGGGVGYLVFHGTKSSTPTTTASPSASPIATAATAAPSVTAPPSSPSASTTSAGAVVPCGAITAPAGQHALGSPGAAPSGTHADASLDFCGQGSTTIPTGSTAFTTGDNWAIGYATSCPAGTAPGGMGTAVTVTEQVSDGSAGPDSPVEIPGDWSSDGGAAMATGGTYQLQVTSVSSSCVWHIAIYAS